MINQLMITDKSYLEMGLELLAEILDKNRPLDIWGGMFYQIINLYTFKASKVYLERYNVILVMIDGFSQAIKKS